MIATFLALSTRLKLISISVIVVAALALTAYAAWSWKGALAAKELSDTITQKDEEKRQAVDDAISEATKQVEEERRLRKIAQGRASTASTNLARALRDLSDREDSIRNQALESQRDNPDFYKQSLPDKGYEAWIRARNLAASAPSSSTASAPSR